MVFNQLISIDLVAAYQYAYYTIIKPLIVRTGVTHPHDFDYPSSSAHVDEDNTNVNLVQFKSEDRLSALSSCDLLSTYRYGYYPIVKVFSWPPSTASSVLRTFARLVIKSQDIGVYLQRSSALVIEDVPTPPVHGPSTGMFFCLNCSPHSSLTTRNKHVLVCQTWVRVVLRPFHHPGPRLYLPALLCIPLQVPH